MKTTCLIGVPVSPFPSSLDSARDDITELRAGWLRATRGIANVSPRAESRGEEQAAIPKAAATAIKLRVVTKGLPAMVGSGTGNPPAEAAATRASRRPSEENPHALLHRSILRSTRTRADFGLFGQ